MKKIPITRTSPTWQQIVKESEEVKKKKFSYYFVLLKCQSTNKKDKINWG